MNDKWHHVEKQAEKIYVSQPHIEELEQFFKDRELPPDPVKLDEGVFVHYPNMFVEGHMFVLKDAPNKKWVVPYYHRLLKYAASLGFISGNPKISELPPEPKKVKKEKVNQPQIPIQPNIPVKPFEPIPAKKEVEQAPQRVSQDFFKSNSINKIVGTEEKKEEKKVEPVTPPKPPSIPPEQTSLF